MLTHEVFHTNGLADMSSTATTAQSLNDANKMAQLVAELATGLTDACYKFSHGMRCDKPVVSRAVFHR